MRCVLDASAALSFVLGDESGTASAAHLDYVVEHGAVVPWLWTFEVANGLLAAVRRGRLSEASLTTAMTGLALLPVESADETSGDRATIELARRLDLTVYDAAYVALAIHRRAPLATLDLELATASRVAGVSLVPGAPDG